MIYRHVRTHEYTTAIHICTKGKYNGKVITIMEALSFPLSFYLFLSLPDIRCMVINGDAEYSKIF